MDRNDYQRLRELFEEALALEESQRGVFITDACGDDAGLRSQLESLLADEGARSRSLAADSSRSSDPSARKAKSKIRLPKRIAGYQIKKFLGEGGMGVVVLADQISPPREVALKLIRPEFLSDSALQRFHFEARVLGRLRHPGIAQIYEAGTFESEAQTRPFFAMELIKGRPLDRHVKKTRPSLSERLELFIKICDAIHHAHQHGVVHRDIKPGNILIEPSGQPKILDFGIARAIDTDIQAVTRQTDMGALVGTLHYMSPEQASGDPEAIDTRSDIYSLGVLLYQLLSDTLPLDIESKPLHEAVRVICEDPPTPLSSIDRVFRGDLQTIVEKALEKEKSRRYQSAAALAEDVQRYLDDEPIDARPHTVVYQLGKFAARNRALVGGAAAVFLALAVGTTAATRFGIAAKRSEAEAITSAEIAKNSQEEAERERLAAIEARDEADAARSDAELAQQQEHEQHVLAQEAQQQAEQETQRLDMLVAGLSETLDQLYRRHSTAAAVERVLRDTVEFCREVLGSDDPRTLHFEFQLGALYVRHERFDDAARSLEETFRNQRRVLTDTHRDTRATFDALVHTYEHQKKYTIAEEHYREFISACSSAMPEDDPILQNLQQRMGYMFLSSDQFAEAEQVFYALLESRRRTLEPDSWLISIVQSYLGEAISKQGRHEEAEPLLIGGYEGLKDAPRIRDELRDKAGQRIVANYEAWDKPEQANDWRDKLPAANNRATSRTPARRPVNRARSPQQNEPATFFGAPIQEARVAFILDASGSMDKSRKLSLAVSELVDSLESLPSDSYFYIALYNSTVLTVPDQRGWIPATRAHIQSTRRWLTGITPSGGTLPLPAFRAVANLPELPDVIVFLTDGELRTMTESDISDLMPRGTRSSSRSGSAPGPSSRRGSSSRKVVIHTIAFGDAARQDLLKKIASYWRGQYRYIPVR